MKPTHAPLPWQANKSDCADIRISADPSNEPIAEVVGAEDYATRRANAARIVCAVNNHEALLASLKRVLTWAEVYAQTNDIDTFSGKGPLSQDCCEARALISAATEQPKP